MSCAIELEVGPGSNPGEFITRVVDAPAGGEPSAVFQLDIEGLLRERDALENTVLASGASARRIVPAHEQQLRRMGGQLFEALFSDRVLGAYRASLGVAQQRGEPLRLVLRLTAPQLAALPWEALFDPETEAYMCRREPLVRHVPAPYTRDPLEITPPLRMLGLVASPRGLPRLDVEAEQQRLSEALATPIAEGLIELEWLTQASWDGVHEKLLESEWHVLHFIGHGDYDVVTDQGQIALEGDGGRADLVEAEQLADLLNEARPTPRLVVLNSCSSGEQGTRDLFSGTAAALVRSGINAVAAMQFTISDTAAISFARGFYTAIALGRSVDDASRSGRISMLGKARSLEWVTPVLYVRGETTQLFSVATTERQGRHHDRSPELEDKRGLEQPAQTPPADVRPAIPLAGLQAMYVQARAELRAECYAAAIGLFDDLLSLYPDYRDAATLRDDAVRRRDLADRYLKAIDAQSARDWNTAARLYEQVLELQPGHPEAAARREQCEHAQRIVDLQDELRIHAGSHNWQAVVDVNDELAALDPAAADPDGLATQARKALRALAEETALGEHYERARADEEAGDWTKAISQYRSLSGYRDAEIRLHTCQQRQHQADIAKRRQTLIDEMTALHQAGRWGAVLDAAPELAQLDPHNSDPGGIVSESQAKVRDAELADTEPADRDAEAVDYLQQAHLRDATGEPAEVDVAQRTTPPPQLPTETTPPGPPSTATTRPPVTVKRRRQIAAVSVVVVTLVGGLTALALGQGSDTTTSTSTSASMSTTSAPATPTQVLGPNETIDDYLKNNHIQQTTITPATPGAPKIDIPVPEGWKRMPDGPDAGYFGIEFNTPTIPSDPPKIVATVRELTGDVDTDLLLAAAPRELKNLAGYAGGEAIVDTLSGYPASRLGGPVVQNGVTRMVAQSTVVIDDEDGIYLLQINLVGPEPDGDALKTAAAAIREKTTITP